MGLISHSSYPLGTIISTTTVGYLSFTPPGKTLISHNKATSHPLFRATSRPHWLRLHLIFSGVRRDGDFSTVPHLSHRWKSESGNLKGAISKESFKMIINMIQLLSTEPTSTVKTSWISSNLSEGGIYWNYIKTTDQQARPTFNAASRMVKNKPTTHLSRSSKIY